ncbi:GNAT family N-acetyltransferase [Lachnospiraceae bacterium NSJ-143]|nr:GNAT family N-acetyltransferase [Lachnospiraceae bacterium NSJ-143]
MKNDILQLDKKFADDFWLLRKELFKELGEISEYMDASELELATKQYFLSHINRDLISWGIFQQGKLVAIGSLCLFTRIPYQENLSGLEGYILNIYTSPQFRKYGYANQILDTIIEYSHKNNIRRLWLNYSEQGKYLYTKKGFIKKDNEMELFL